ncbi:ArsR/SmtB family transcription factor [Lysobacter soyae]|uniref:Metalloregulator ArsR/SmtB family transcription factor n=1 Tax=Lysobacter soyae TaxID=2764185 RepID=A0ABX8WMH5_9GAMM|nr:metalloregulator ArsR/SmtB family transcription factor [Lysobacter sp. CJ11]QYR52842.1 metalloregulator ArsR/SmtB family transcription factor [Lysobacter sp. CJ11]
MKLSDALAGLAALGHETRLRAFRDLVAAGTEGRTVGNLRERLNVPAATLTAHLNVLRHAGLVSDSREGRSIHVTANYKAMNQLIDYLTENCCEGSGGCGPAPVCPSPKAKKTKVHAQFRGAVK